MVGKWLADSPDFRRILSQESLKNHLHDCDMLKNSLHHGIPPNCSAGFFDSSIPNSRCPISVTARSALCCWRAARLQRLSIHRCPMTFWHEALLFIERQYSDTTLRPNGDNSIQRVANASNAIYHDTQTVATLIPPPNNRNLQMLLHHSVRESRTFCRAAQNSMTRRDGEVWMAP